VIRIFPELENAILVSVSIFPGDRVVDFYLQDGRHLYFSILSQRGNIHLCDEKTCHAFKKSGKMPDFSDMRSLSPKPPNSIEEDPRFNKYWTKNLPEVLGSDNYHELLEIIENSNGKIFRGRFVYFPAEDYNPAVFYENYRDFVIERLKGDHLGRDLEKVKGLLGSRMQKLQRQLKKPGQEDTIRRLAEKYAFYADTLNSLRYMLSRDMSELEIPDMYQKADMPHKIPLKQGLDINGQIDRYYRKASKSQQEITDLKERISTMEAEWKNLSKLYFSLEHIDDLQTFREWEKKNRTKINVYKRSVADPSGTRLPYREHITKDGWRIWVGRSARDNDDMSFHYASKQDLWLHTRHSTGSHVIIRKDGRKDVPNHIILKAAGLAARYSDEKHSNLVTVVCTERKYVTKRKGMPAGKVHYQFEKDYMVEPQMN